MNRPPSMYWRFIRSHRVLILSALVLVALWTISGRVMVVANMRLGDYYGIRVDSGRLGLLWYHAGYYRPKPLIVDDSRMWWWDWSCSFGASDQRMWSRYIPLWWPISLLLAWIAVLMWRCTRRVRRSDRRGLCHTCAYPIGVSEVCTECGAPVVREWAKGLGHSETA